MKRGIVFGIAGGALLVGSVVSAQETGSLITRKPAQIDSRDKDSGRKILEIFSTCVVERAYGRAAKLIDMPIDTAEYQKQINAVTFGYDDCLSGGDLGMGLMTLRGGLFRAFYNREFKLDGPVVFDSAVDTGYRNRYSEPYSEEANTAIMLEAFAECVVRADGSNVRLLVKSVAASTIEASAIQALAPKFGPCLSQGNKVKFNKTVLKGVLAEGLYRLSMAVKKSDPQGSAVGQATK